MIFHFVFRLNFFSPLSYCCRWDNVFLLRLEYWCLGRFLCTKSQQIIIISRFEIWFELNCWRNTGFVSDAIRFSMVLIENFLIKPMMEPKSAVAFNARQLHDTANQNRVLEDSPLDSRLKWANIAYLPYAEWGCCCFVFSLAQRLWIRNYKM